MTKYGVMTMTDAELRIRVAELLGARTAMPLPAVLTWKQGAIIGQWEDKERGEIWKEIPDYPNDIKAAWKLVDYMLDHYNGWAFTLMTGRDGAGYSATFEDFDGKKVTAADNSLVPLPGRAIARAFILAMGKEER